MIHFNIENYTVLRSEVLPLIPYFTRGNKDKRHMDAKWLLKLKLV